ncbi:MAG TPA: hypothetical protein VK631_11655 [Solirubrobacteraceae bacterium]|nr:hypothetical protein [Solirubrobacteraceae bacterium]
MRRIVEQHVARLRRAQRAPQELVFLRDRLLAQLYPPAAAPLRAVRQERIPADAPDWYFDAELRRSGLWAMMERCYPTAQAQAQ